MARIAGVEVETKISLTGLIAVAMAFTAIVGGWYSFGARQQQDEQAIVQLQANHQQEMQMHEHLDDTLTRLDKAVGMLQQRMDDSHVGHPENEGSNR